MIHVANPRKRNGLTGGTTIPTLRPGKDGCHQRSRALAAESTQRTATKRPPLPCAQARMAVISDPGAYGGVSATDGDEATVRMECFRLGGALDCARAGTRRSDQKRVGFGKPRPLITSRQLRLES